MVHGKENAAAAPKVTAAGTGTSDIRLLEGKGIWIPSDEKMQRFWKILYSRVSRFGSYCYS
jgi:hypothetical protein